MAILSNDTVFLRAVEPEDLDLLYKWENDSSLWKCGDTVNPYSRFAIKSYIERTLSEDAVQIGQLRLMVCLAGSGAAVGMADLFDIDMINGRSGTGIFMAEEYRGNGFTGMVIKMMEEYSRKVLALHQLYAHIATSNEPCIKCFERNGFVRSGVLKEWKRCGCGYSDVYIYQKIL